MSIDETFRELKKNGEGALIAYITGGDPAPNHRTCIETKAIEPQEERLIETTNKQQRQCCQ